MLRWPTKFNSFTVRVGPNNTGQIPGTAAVKKKGQTQLTEKTFLKKHKNKRTFVLHSMCRLV